MSFVRPEAQASLKRYSGVLACVGLAVVLVFAMTRTQGYLPYVFGVALIIPGALGWDAVRRLRFPGREGGFGVVEVDERQITYLARHGGAISIEALTRVEAHRNARGSITWVFMADDTTLSVPAEAKGAPKLFDALTALPGVNYAQAEAAAKGEGPDLFLIWTRDRTKLH